MVLYTDITIIQQLNPHILSRIMFSLSYDGLKTMMVGKYLAANTIYAMPQNFKQENYN